MKMLHFGGSIIKRKTNEYRRIIHSHRKRIRSPLIVDVLYCEIAIGHLDNQSSPYDKFCKKALCIENEILV